MKATSPEQPWAGGWHLYTEAVRALGVWVALQRCPGLGTPSLTLWHHWGGRCTSAAFMSSFFHVELHL